MFNFFKLNYWKFFFIYLRACKLIDRERYDEAISIIVNFLEKKIFATEAIYYELGKAYFGKKNYRLAIESFKMSIEYNSSDDIYKANTYFYLGLAYYESEKFHEAVDTFKKAIQIKKGIKLIRDSVMSLPHIYCYLGRSYVKLDEPEEAYKIFNEGLKYEPNNEALQRELTLLGI